MFRGGFFFSMDASARCVSRVSCSFAGHTREGFLIEAVGKISSSNVDIDKCANCPTWEDNSLRSRLGYFNGGACMGNVGSRRKRCV